MSVVDDVDDNVRWQAIAALGRIGRPAATVSIPLMTAAWPTGMRVCVGQRRWPWAKCE
ncbi:MAG: hypothetical protein CM1200mP2_19390 [Planctomycetaceae bacterium]|nr:MAG: hypothetical protein CM1200mP2_19390 [Planctomycetaceae bacterium]